MNSLWKQILTVIATVAVITVNVLANALPINGKNTGEISDQFQVYFTPAGYVFSIWGLIYIGLIAYTIYQALPAQRDNAVLGAIAPLYWLSCLANIVWIFLWHYEVFFATLIAMLILLGSLIAIYLRLDIGHAAVSPPMRWAVHATFSVYLGWITVATIANASALLWLLGWRQLRISDEAWTTVVLALAVIVSIMITYSRRDIAYLLVLVWAFVGIYVRNPDVPLVATSAIGAALVVGLLVLLSILPGGSLPLNPR